MQKAMVIRTIVLAVALLNQTLVMFGWSPLPYSNEEIEHGLTALFTVVVTGWNWYKNNSVTDEGKAADEYLQHLKNEKKKK